jgi:hypothetical protein
MIYIFLVCLNIVQASLNEHKYDVPPVRDKLQPGVFDAWNNGTGSRDKVDGLN